MEGYSVTEAASVLGVPTERVWELLARGVLSGVPDGETGMRVFLQPRPAPPAVEEPRRSNGGGSSHEPEAEASPFRELLSEFRNLTERYGQALLALGESRGEVASLRSRVDLLEARFDLRLPMSGPMTAQAPAAAAWDPGQRSARTMAETPTPTDDVPGAAPPDHDDADPSPPRRRRRGQHRATDDFAEALARAEDPSPAELPGGEEAAAAFAALRDEAAHRTTEHADAALPRELPAAEPIASIEPEVAVEAVPEPIAEAPAVEPKAAVEEVPEPIVEALAAPDTEPEVAVEAVPEPIAEAHAAEAETPIEEVTELTAQAPAAEAEAVVDAVPEPDAESAAVEAEPVVEKSEAVVDAVPEPIPDAQPLPALEPQIVFDGLPLQSEPKREPEVAAESEPEPDAWFQPEAAGEPEPHDEPVTEASSSEVEAEPVVEAHPAPVAEAPALSPAEAEVEPHPEPAVEPEPEVEAPSVPVGDVASAPMFEAEPDEAEDQLEGEVASESPTDEEPEEPGEAEPAWEQAARVEPALEPDAESEPALETEPEVVADAELSWDRDRYTARIEEPDWIPEEREAQAPAPATPPPAAERPLADARPQEPDTEGEDGEPATPEPPWVGWPDTSTPREEMMMWFGREPERAGGATTGEEDFAAEMEIAGGGAHASRSSSIPDEQIGARPTPAVPPVTPPDVRAEFRATLATPSMRPQPPSPASRAYRRLRRIFPG